MKHIVSFKPCYSYYVSTVNVLDYRSDSFEEEYEKYIFLCRTYFYRIFKRKNLKSFDITFSDTKIDGNSLNVQVLYDDEGDICKSDDGYPEVRIIGKGLDIRAPVALYTFEIVQDMFNGADECYLTLIEDSIVYDEIQSTEA